MPTIVANANPERNSEAIRANELLPSFFKRSAEDLLKLLEEYYRYLNSDGMPSFELDNVTQNRDLDLASEKYFTRIRSLIGNSVPNSRVLNNAELYKIVVKYYNTRGSDDSVHTFFKIFFDEVVEIYYPKLYLFDLSSPNSLPSDKYKIFDGDYWQEYSYVIRTSFDSVGWINDYKNFVHPAGMKLFVAVAVEIFLRNDGWNEEIDYSSSHLNKWLRALIPPYMTDRRIQGHHSPKYQIGWLRGRILKYLFETLADSNLLRTFIVKLQFTLKANAHLEAVRRQYKRTDKFLDSGMISEGWLDKVIGDTTEEWSNTNKLRMPNLSSYINITTLPVSEARLSSLLFEVPFVTWSQTFDPDVYEYYATVDAASTVGTYINATAIDPACDIMMNTLFPLTSGVNSPPWYLEHWVYNPAFPTTLEWDPAAFNGQYIEWLNVPSVGASAPGYLNGYGSLWPWNVIEIVVTSADTNTTRTYRYNILLESSDATLASSEFIDQDSIGIVASDFTPPTPHIGFGSPNSFPVDNTVTDVAFLPTPANYYMWFTINGSLPFYWGGSPGVNWDWPTTFIPLTPGPYGTNLIEVVTYSEDGSSVLTYTYDIKRISAAPTLDSLDVSADAQIAIEFDSNALFYQGFASYSTTDTTFTVVGTATAPGGPVFDMSIGIESLADGIASSAYPLSHGPVGTNMFEIVVTAIDESTTETYAIDIVRLSEVPILDGIVASAGAISPTFDANTYAYTISVANAVTDTTFTIDWGALYGVVTVTINSDPIAAGVETASYALAVGANSFMIQLTALDEITTEMYSVEITRAA